MRRGVMNKVKKAIGVALASLIAVSSYGVTVNAAGMAIDSEPTNGFEWSEKNNNSGYWYVNNSTGECVTPGWHVRYSEEYDGKKYQEDFYVDSNGYVKSNNFFLGGYQSQSATGQKKWEWKSDANGWYYTNGDKYLWYDEKNANLEEGSGMGIFNIDGTSYAFDSAGYLIKPNTWVKKGGFWTGGWYYVGDTEGVCVDGWQQIDGEWYYFYKGYDWLDVYGKMLTNEYVDGYYLKEDGTMGESRGEWHQDEKGWWFGDQFGWYAKGERVVIDRVWYTFDEDGYLKDK